MQYRPCAVAAFIVLTCLALGCHKQPMAASTLLAEARAWEPEQCEHRPMTVSGVLQSRQARTKEYEKTRVTAEPHAGLLAANTDFESETVTRDRVWVTAIIVGADPSAGELKCAFPASETAALTAIPIGGDITVSGQIVAIDKSGPETHIRMAACSLDR